MKKHTLSKKERESFKTTASLLPLNDPKVLFEDLERLGEGSFGTVHRMQDRRVRIFLLDFTLTSLQ